jgi:cytochrome c oxidase subunit 1
MTTVTAQAAVATEAHPQRRAAFAFLITGFVALLLGALLGPLQALNYAGVDLYQYLPFLQSYYQGLTLHGVLNALVFTTYLNAAILLYFPAREMQVPMNVRFVWATYGVMTGGLAIAAIAILSNTSNVLYTFYPPLSGHWGFYLGLALVVVASLMVAYETLRMRHVWRRQNPGKVTPIITYMAVMTQLMWILASIGIVVEVVVFLLPWSMGLIQGVDPGLARTLFWWTGHPIVYYWLLPAYISWYGFMPKQAGGELVSDSLTRLAFLMFLMFSTPVGFHHQFTDPGIAAGWKMVHSLLTMFVGIPSLITAFTVAASLEVGGKRAGGKGVFGWIGKLPWGRAAFTAQVLAMIAFIFGGAGGIVNASFNLDPLVNDTAWIPGHFHLTVGTAVTLTFMGMSFWWVPHLIGKRLFSNRMALASAWTWFAGMMVFGLGMHWQGLFAVPRRAQISAAPAGTYADAAVPMVITGISGVILLVALILYFTVLFGTIFSNSRLSESERPAIPFVDAVEYRSVGILRALDTVWGWFALAALLVAVAYLPTLIDMLFNQVGIQRYQLW